MSKSVGGIKRHHSSKNRGKTRFHSSAFDRNLVEDFQPLKEAKVEESQNQDELLEKGDIVFMCK